eukprot:1159832-Pelagomonas_calceolata.AAC.2
MFFNLLALMRAHQHTHAVASPPPDHTWPSKLLRRCSMSMSALISPGRPLSLMLDTSAYIMPIEGVGCRGRQMTSSRSSLAATRRFCGAVSEVLQTCEVSRPDAAALLRHLFDSHAQVLWGTPRAQRGHKRSWATRAHHVHKRWHLHKPNAVAFCQASSLLVPLKAVCFYNP